MKPHARPSLKLATGAHPRRTTNPAAAGPPTRAPVPAARIARDRQLFIFDRDEGPSTTIARGNVGERQAAEHLERIGMRIVERNFKTKLGELDIIAREGRTLVFVEVRSRSTTTFGSAVEAVNHHKQKQVTRVAWQYIKVRRPKFESARFDVIGITAGDLVHIRDAWRLA